MEEGTDVCNVETTKRKLFEGSLNGDDGKEAKRPRLQVKIPRLKISKEHLENLRKRSAKGKSEPSIIRNEDDEKNVSTVNTSTAPSVSSAGTVTAATTATGSEQVTTVEESPVRHRLSNLLDGSSITPHRETAEQPEEEGNVESIDCKGDSQLDNAESLSGPVPAQDNLFFSEDLLSFSDVCSPLLQEEDCITVPCYPDVVSKTCMQVSETAEQTLFGDNEIEATASFITASEQDEEDREESHESQTSSNGPAANLAEDGPMSGSATPSNCAAAEQLADDALPENKKDENVNAEEGGRETLESAEVKESAMDYASNYNTLEVMNTLLSSLTEEKRARTELEELVSQLEKQNQELVSECGKLRDLVNDLLPLSKVKNETVSRGIQINMDLSLRRGRAVDRATSPLRMMRSPSPDLALTSSSVGCQTVDGSEVASTACQTDPLVRPSLPARPTIQTSTPARVQGIVMPNIQGRVQVPTNCTQASNPVQVAHNQPPPPYLKTHSQVEVARQLSVLSQQEQTLKELMAKQAISAHHNTQQYPTNMYNSTGYQSGMLNVSATGQYVQAPNRFVEISSLVTAQTTGNQTLERTDLNAFSDMHYTGNQRSAINVSSLSAQQTNSPALTQLLTQNQLMAQHNLSVSNRTLSSAPSNLYNTRPSQYVGTQQHSNQHQVTSAGTSQVSARSQSAAIRHKTNMILQFINERRRQIAAAQSLRNSEQLSGTSLQSMACNQVATQQHTEAPPLHHLMSQSQVSQVTQQHAQPNPLTLRNSPQPLGTFSSSTMAYNQVNAHHHTGLTVQQLAQSQASQVTQWIAQPNPASSSNSQQAFAFPPSRMAYNQAVIQQRSDRLQHQVSQPDISQAQLYAQPTPTSMQQDCVNSMIRNQSNQNPPTTQTANSNSHLIRNLLDNALQPSARSQVEAQSLSNEVQLVYNELKKSLGETPSLAKQKQSSTAQASRPSEIQSDQLQTSKNTPFNEQPPKATLSSQTVPSKSEQSVVYCYQTPAKQFNCQDTSQVSASEPVMEMPHSNTNLSEARSKRSVHFSQEANSSEPMDVSSRNENSANHLDASDCTDQSSPGQQESHHSFTDKDPYKAPPKTPSGALEDTVKRLLALQDKIAGTEDSDNGCEPSDDLTESTDDTSQLTTALKSQHSDQEVETTGERNQSNATEDTDKDTNHYNTQQEVEMTSSALEDKQIVDENGIEHFPMTEGEDQDSAAGDGHENSVSDQPDSLAASSPGLNTVGQDKDKQVTSGDENDSSFQDIYIDLMSPVIPQMSVARRFRPHTHAHSSEDDCDADTSMSSTDASNKNEDNANDDDHDDETEDNLEDSQQETSSLCSAVPSDDTNCNQQENGKDTERINNEQENEVDGEEGVSMSSDNTAVGAVDDATEQALCTPKPHEETRTHLGEEQLATEADEGNPPAPAPVSSAHLKSEAVYAPCMNEVVYKNNKVGKKEQREACELNPGAIPKQDPFQETAFVGDIKVTEKIPLRLEKGSEQIIPSSLVKGSLDGSSHIIDSNMNLEHSKMLIAASNQPSNTALLPVPRLALRVVNGNTVIMWDLPPDNNITEINFFEVYVYLIKKDVERQQKRGGRWIKIGEMKAMPLPMACTIRHLIQKKVVYFFIVRAISHSGVPGPYSKPCCVACS